MDNKIFKIVKTILESSCSRIQNYRQHDSFIGFYYNLELLQNNIMIAMLSNSFLIIFKGMSNKWKQLIKSLLPISKVFDVSTFSFLPTIHSYLLSHHSNGRLYSQINSSIFKKIISLLFSRWIFVITLIVIDTFLLKYFDLALQINQQTFT